MKNIKIFSLILFFPVLSYTLTAQTTCTSILNEAKTAYTKNNLRLALKKLQDTEICDYKNELLKERQTLQGKIFDAIEKQKVAAQKAQQEAERQRKIADEEKQRADEEAINAQSAADAAETAARQAGREKLRAEEALKRAEAQSESNRLLVLAIGQKDQNTTHYVRLLEESLKQDPENIAAIKLRRDLLSDTNACFYKQILVGHKDGVSSVAMTPDANFLLTGSFDHTVKLWENGKAEALQTFTGHTSWVSSVAITPDAQFCLSGSDSMAILWKRGKAEPLQIFDTRASTVAMTPDARFFLTGGKESYTKLWEQGKIEPLLILPKNASAVTMTPNAQFLYIGNGDSTTILWERGKKEPLQSFPVDALSVAMTPDARFFLTGSTDSTAKLWERGKVEPIQIFKGHSSEVWSVAMTPDAQYFLTGSPDSTAKLWKRGRTEPLHTFREQSPYLTGVAISSDGRFALTGNFENNAAKLWERRPAELWQTGNRVKQTKVTLAMSPDAQTFLIGTGNGRVRFFKRDEPEPLQTFFENDYDFHRPIIMAPNGRFFLACRIYKNKTELWECGKTSPIQIFRGDSLGGLPLAITPDAKFFLTTGTNNTVVLREYGKNNPIQIFLGHRSFVVSAAMTPDARFLFTGDTDGTAKLWGRGKEYPLQNFYGGKHQITTVAMTTDARFLFTKSFDVAKLWERGKTEPVQIFESNRSPISAVAMTPDARFFLIAKDNIFDKSKTVELWKHGIREPLQVFSFPSPVTSISVTPDAHFFLTGHEDGMAKLQAVTVMFLDSIVSPLLPPDKITYDLPVSVEEILAFPLRYVNWEGIGYFETKYRKNPEKSHLEAMQQLAAAYFAPENTAKWKEEKRERWIEDLESLARKNADTPVLEAFYQEWVERLKYR